MSIELEETDQVVRTPTRDLTRRFVLTGIVAMVLIVLFVTCRGYYVLRATGIESEALRVSVRVSEAVSMVTDNAVQIEKTHLAKVALSFHHLSGIESVAIFNTDLKHIWSNDDVSQLSSEQIDLSLMLLKDKKMSEKVIDRDFFRISTWVDSLFDSQHKLPILIELKDASGQSFALAKVDYDFHEAIRYARLYGFRLFLLSALCSSILFFVLYKAFRRGIKTIDAQEQELTEQIGRLSNLLVDNKKLQSSMKTASARAVELNEQFLRRVGADLHDGPAQMIGFAVLRLNQVSKQEAAKEFGHEFHAVRESLDESLEEIRGISSGLVLPQLENMSVEQCLRKVVMLHTANSKTKVDQFYQDMPDDIALPIKICVYRFIQEGLNNAQRHGQADKCRLSAYTKGDELIVSLKDNGMGFRKSKLSSDEGRLGLIGMKDRIESLGGTFSINSELGVGTALKVALNFSNDLS